MNAGAATNVWTIIVAAGASQRFGADKLAAVIDPPGGTVLRCSMSTAAAASDGLVVVVGEGSPLLDDGAQPGATALDASAPLVVLGGPTRSASVRNGLAAVPAEASIVLVHDGARPLATAALYQRVIGAVAGGAAVAVPAIPVVDTIRAVDGGVVDRDQLRAVQTPQGFAADVLRAAHAASGEATDDAALAESAGHAVTLVEGEVANLKITRPADLVVARSHLEDSRGA